MKEYQAKQKERAKVDHLERVKAAAAGGGGSSPLRLVLVQPLVLCQLLRLMPQMGWRSQTSSLRVLS